MTPRLKKFLGLFLLLPGMAVYFAAAIILADHVPAFWMAKLVYFIIAGVIWVFPVRCLMQWMSAGPSRNGTRPPPDATAS